MTVNRYEKVEIPVPSPTCAILRAPDGTERPLPSLSVTDPEFCYDGMGLETVHAKGEHHVLRFFPDLCGTYTLIFHDTEKKIRVMRGKHHGYVEVSKCDPRYFAFSDGTPYMPIGINLAFPSAIPKKEGGFGTFGMRQYERWFRTCAENGVTMARIWLGHEYFCPDTLEVGQFDPIKIAKIDAIVDMARRYGLRLKLVIEQFRYFNYDKKADSDSYEDDVFRKFNKNLYKNGRRCESSEEWLADPVWQDAWLEKIAALAARLSGDPTVFAIELWNEMNCMPKKHLNAWNLRMLPAVKALFPHHLVTNSWGSLDSDRELETYGNFCWEASDLKEIHRYLDRGAKLPICRDDMIALIKDGLAQISDPSKPTVFSESGAVNDCHSGPFPHYLQDHDGILFCDAVYPPVFLGAADCGNIWHWDARYVESKNLYHLYRPLRLLCRNLAFDREQFTHEAVETEDMILLLLRGKTTTIGYLRNKNETWQTRLRDGKENTPITDKMLCLPVNGVMKSVSIRKNGRDRLSFSDGKLTVHHLEFGALLKWTHSPASE